MTENKICPGCGDEKHRREHGGHHNHHEHHGSRGDGEKRR